uniref:DUF4355 domain-containing protein n=1 Tax=candidate division CPR3 bacterium TaxID=2268181 RepID=A0A7V3N6E8_UNCC3
MTKVNESDQVEALFENPQSEEKTEEEKTVGESSPVQEKFYTLPDGRKVTAEQVYEEYQKLLPEFTKRSQELSELKKKTEASVEDETARQVREELKKHGVVFKDELEQEKNQLVQSIRQEIEYEQRLKELEKEIDGSDGRPPFRREEVLAHMSKVPIYEPLKAYEDLHRAKIDEWKIQQFLAKKQGLSTYESVRGRSVGTPPPPAPSKSVGKMSDNELKNLIVEELNKPTE